MVRLVELKEKYRQALKAIDKEGVRLSPKPLDLKENKLFIEGLAPSHQAKNHVFDEIKAIDTNYESDLICHLTVATAKVINVTPLTLYANLAEVKGGATIDCEFLIAGLIEIGFFAPERPESPYCRLETKEVKEGSTLKIDPNLLCERWPYNWRTAEPWVYLLNVEIAYRELKTPPPFDRKQFFQSVIVTNNTGQFVDAYRVYGKRRERHRRMRPGLQARFEVAAIKPENRGLLTANTSFDLWEFRTSQSDELVGMAIISPLDAEPQVTLSKKPILSVQVGSKPRRVVNATDLGLKLDYDVTDLAGDLAAQTTEKSLPPLDSVVLENFPQTEIGEIRLAVKDAETGAKLASFDLHPSSPPLTLIPASLQWPPKGLQRIGEKREKTPKQDDKSFISHSTVRKEFTRDFFNGRKNCVLREVEIAGPKLIWGSNNILKDYYGASANNIRSMTIYADRMEVDVSLLFPGTNVTIYTRELVFSGSGCINTTPLPISEKAKSEYFTKDPEDLTNDHAPADKDGKPTYQAADGATGQKGGDITVYAQRVLIPPGAETTRRFIAQGGKGQGGEAGGLKKYVAPLEGNRHTIYQATSPITAHLLGQFIEEKTTLRAAKRQDYWRWPEKEGTNSPEVHWTSEMKIEDKDKRNVLETGNCVAVSLYAYSDEGFPGIPWKERGFLPSREFRSGPPAKWNEFDKENPGPLPCDGRNAYPGGWPGDGGNGGKIALHLESGSIAESLCDVRPGSPGDPTEEFKGGSPPGPVPAYTMEIKIVKRDTVGWESSRKPIATLKEVIAKPGASAKGREIYVGKKPQNKNDLRQSEARNGTIECTKLQHLTWAQPAAIAAVLRHAQTAYRNGFRKETEEGLKPYLACIREGKLGQADGRLGFLLRKIELIRDNLESNLDYYGNPPGWVPLLDALTNLQYLNSVRKAAYGTYYFAQKMLNDYEALVDTRDLSLRTTTALEEELQTARVNLGKAYEELPKAIGVLDAVQLKLGPVKYDIDTLRDRAFDKTKSTVVAQRMFSAGMQILGGVAKALPVGQPFLGVAGSTFEAASQIDWNAPDPLESARSSINSFSKSVTDFTRDKKDQVAAVVGGDLLKESAKKVDEVTDLTRRLADEEDKSKDAEKATMKEWNKFKNTEQELLTQQIEKTELAKKDLAPAPDPTKLSDESDEKFRLRLEAHKKTEAEKAEETKKADSFLKTLNSRKEALGPNVEKFDDALLQYELRQAEFEKKASLLVTSQNATLKKLGKEHGGRVPDSVRQKMEEQKTVATLANLPENRRQKIAAERGLEDQKKLIERREKTTKEVMTNLEGLGAGLGMIGNGIVSAATPITKDNPTWKRLAEQLLVDDPELRKLGRELNEKLQGILEEKRRAADNIMYWRQEASTCAATIASNLGALTELSRQRQSVNQGLDPAVKGYLQDTMDRAEEAVAKSIYWFVKSYQYEYLTDVDKNFYNFDDWTKKLQAQELAKLTPMPEPPKAGEPPKADQRLQRDPKIVLSQEEFEKIGNEVFKAVALQLSEALFDVRQKRINPLEGKYESCVLKRSTAIEEAWQNEMLDSLLQRGEISFSFVQHFNKGSFSLYDARVTDVDLKEFTIETEDSNLSLTVRIVHSGRSVIRKKEDRAYYAFESGRNDDPVSWQWVYNQSQKKQQPNQSGLTKSVPRQERILQLMKAVLDNAPTNFNEYSPGLFSDYVLRISDLDDTKRRAIKKINSVVMDVKIAQG